MDRLSFDTTFLIDLQRERNRAPGKAHRFLERRADATPYCSRIVMGEYAEGFEDPRSRPVRLMLDSFEPLEITPSVVWCYARITRDLRGHGEMIGANDCWIAACSLEAGYPLVTRNLEHFMRIPDLQILPYRDA